ncbi:MAG: type II toxin-antitoxin system VapC family toxin [Spirochaetaceae bacterium]|nr:type II toxin-antitoxin system VapC family toxin [Spirochaetaceae bacterium]
MLDTHVLLHALTEPERLARTRSDAIESPANAVFASAVSIAEIAIKVSIGKLRVDVDLLPAVEDAGFEWLDFSPREALRLAELPLHHRDPFDRMLVVQSQANDLALVTDDAKLAAYDCRIL